MEPRLIYKVSGTHKGPKQMNFNKSFATILTIALTAGINASVIAAPVSQKSMKEARLQNQKTETIQKQETETNKKNRKPSQNNSQGNKCIPGWC